MVDGTHIEKLHQNGIDLYSIRYPKSKCNPRVIFFFASQEEDIILLCAILEKSSGDYQNAIRKAITRVKSIGVEM